MYMLSRVAAERINLRSSLQQAVALNPSRQ